MLQPMVEALDTEEDILSKFAVIMEKQDIPLIYAIKHDFPPHFKFKNQNHD